MTCGGSFCPLLLAADVNLAEIADEAGNSVEVLSSNYLGVLNEPRGMALVDAEGAIQVARASRVRHLAEGACDCYRPKPHEIGKPSSGLEPSTPSL